MIKQGWLDMPLLPCFNEQDAKQWIALARFAIQRQWHPELLAPPHPLNNPTAACFVTLTKHGQLRGCIGTLQADKPLDEGILYFSVAAANYDPRFPPVTESEFTECKISISVLSKKEPTSAQTREEIESVLIPGETGLWLTDGERRATFLPAVWEQLPTKSEFIDHLLMKGGWPSHQWPDDMQAFLYNAVEMHE